MINSNQLIFVNTPENIDTLNSILDDRISELKERLVTVDINQVIPIQSQIAELKRLKNIKEIIIQRKNDGITDVMSTGKTAAGMSMLMGAAAQNIKAVVRNLDDYLLAPLGSIS